MKAGEHLNMVSHYSEVVRNILDALLQASEAKRATIRDILHFPGVADEVNKLKTSPQFRQQFTEAKNHISIDGYFQRITSKGLPSSRKPPYIFQPEKVNNINKIRHPYSTLDKEELAQQFSALKIAESAEHESKETKQEQATPELQIAKGDKSEETNKKRWW